MRFQLCGYACMYLLRNNILFLVHGSILKKYSNTNKFWFIDRGGTLCLDEKPEKWSLILKALSCPASNILIRQLYCFLFIFFYFFFSIRALCNAWLAFRFLNYELGAYILWYIVDFCLIQLEFEVFHINDSFKNQLIIPFSKTCTVRMTETRLC